MSPKINFNVIQCPLNGSWCLLSWQQSSKSIKLTTHLQPMPRSGVCVFYLPSFHTPLVSYKSLAISSRKLWGCRIVDIQITACRSWQQETPQNNVKLLITYLAKPSFTMPIPHSFLPNVTFPNQIILTVFLWDMMPCSLVCGYKFFEGNIQSSHSPLKQR